MRRRFMWRSVVTAAVMAATLGTYCSDSTTAPPDADPSSSPEPLPPWRFIELGDLTELRERGALRVLVRSRPEMEHLPRSGHPFQRERALAEQFADSLNLELVLVPLEAPREFIPAILEGKGDIALVKLPPPEDRHPELRYTLPVTAVREMVVTRAGGEPAKRVEDLAATRVALLGSMQHTRPVEDLRRELPGVELEVVHGPHSPDDLLHQVATGKRKAALVDSNWMQIASEYRDDLQVAFELPETQRLVGAVRTAAPDLLDAVNGFLIAAPPARSGLAGSTDDLPEIRRRGVLRVLMLNEPPSYFLHRGDLMGFEYELARQFAKRHGLRLEVVVPPDRRDLGQWLLQGKADLIAADLRENDFASWQGISRSRYYAETRQSVAVATDGGETPRLDDLQDGTLRVPASARMWPALEAQREEVGFRVVETRDESAAQMIDTVASGEYQAALVPGHVLKHEASWRSGQDVRAVLTADEPDRLYWAVRNQDPELLNALNGFLEEEYRGLTYNVLRQRYFERGPAKRPASGSAPADGRISPYDDLVRPYAQRYRLDWRLAVAVMYQESRFDPTARSSAGALGLFQLMPRTAQELGVTNLTDPETAIHGGLKYLHWIRSRFPTDLRPVDRLAFTGAAYNVGYGHVVDARRVAETQGWDPNRWFGHVEKAMLMLSDPAVARKTRFGYCRGAEPYQYVREIRGRFQSYVRAAER